MTQQSDRDEQSSEPEIHEPPYGPSSPERLGAWLPPAQRIGPSLTWLLIGAVTAAFVGWLGIFLADEFIATEAEQLRRVFGESALLAYEQAYEPAFALAYEDRVNRETAQYLEHEGMSVDSDWGREFQRGWTDGWNDALDAMRAASLEAGLRSDSRELQTLAAEPHRNPVP